MAAFVLSADTNRRQRKYTFGDDRNVSMCVYTITNRETGRAYVGQSVGKVSRRWMAHINKSGAGLSAIKSALRKYGHEAFVFAVIDVAETREQLDRRERFWIERLNTVAPNGYNFCDGGSGGRVFSEESRRKMSESARARWPEGYVTRKQRRQMRTPEEKAAAIEAGNARRRGKPTWLSVHGVTPEMVEKARQKKIGRPVPKKWKRIVRDDGVEFPSVHAAADAIGCKAGSLSAHLTRRRKTMYGHVYIYKED